MFMNKVVIIAVVGVVIASCSSKYQPLTSQSSTATGYKEERLNEGETPAEYKLSYQGNTSDSEERLGKFWHKRAKELCPIDYTTFGYYVFIEHGSVTVPINGSNQRVATRKLRLKGTIKCAEASVSSKASGL